MKTIWNNEESDIYMEISLHEYGWERESFTSESDTMA